MPRQETVSELMSFGGADSTVPRRTFSLERAPGGDLNTAKREISLGKYSTHLKELQAQQNICKNINK